ncbi:MAG: hypothetical protein JXA14_12040 [Anaerolineae bacterium]|nr:hypothetical protein [Anaerolineae bacterium]
MTLQPELEHDSLLDDEQPIDVPDLAPAFGEGGPIARVLGERYRYREGQAQMARLIRQALIEGKPAVVEAGTGCGKSFAYLIPLIWSGVRALVSTANKTLQTQLWEKDLPALAQVSPRLFTAALLKGRSNYVCRVKMGMLGQQPALPGLAGGVIGLMERLQDCPSGDVEDLGLLGPARDAVTAGHAECPGSKCPQASKCYYEMAKLHAEAADIVVINHALLAFSLQRPILAPRPVVVVDEAHELEGYVINALRLTLEYDTVPKLVNGDMAIRHVNETLRQEAVRVNHSIFQTLSDKPFENEWRWAVKGELQEGSVLAGHLSAIAGQLLRAYPAIIDDDDDRDVVNARHQAAIEYAQELAEQVRALASETPLDQVRYCEEQRHRSSLERFVLCQEPIQVADFLHDALFEPIKRVVCTGATLSVDRRFDYFRQRTGVPVGNVVEQVIDSPFDFPAQAVLYTPNGLEPQYGEGEEEYVLKLGREVYRLVQASKGRAFVLCTSVRRMKELYELVSPHLDYSCYCQGNGFSRAELLDLFQNDAGGAVLFATRSFWEGVDVPGEALSMVIIDKLPFAPHHDPVVQHRQQRIRDQGGNPFYDMLLPEAILTLKQGVGRLIRTETDRGVIAILDSRINTKQYGQQIVASLPRARRTRQMQDVRAFFTGRCAETIKP